MLGKKLQAEVFRVDFIGLEPLSRLKKNSTKGESYLGMQKKHVLMKSKQHSAHCKE